MTSMKVLIIFFATLEIAFLDSKNANLDPLLFGDELSDILDLADTGSGDTSDNCTQIQCQYGGTCYPSPNGHICKCVTGFEGSDCSKSLYFFYFNKILKIKVL